MERDKPSLIGSKSRAGCSWTTEDIIPKKGQKSLTSFMEFAANNFDAKQRVKYSPLVDLKGEKCMAPYSSESLSLIHI